MSTLNMLYRTEYQITDNIKVIVPFLGDILSDEDGYYNLVSIITSSPVDVIPQLEEAGIDFTEIDDYSLFLIFFPGLISQNTSLIFGDLDLSKFELAQSEQNGLPILEDKANGIIIDKHIYSQIAAALRKIHNIEKNNKKPANEEAKKFMIRRAKEKARRNRNRKKDSQLENLIIAMVNTEQFKYNYRTVLDLTIYQFNESVKQIINKVDYEHVMNGVYAGTVDAKKLTADQLNWLKHK